MFRFFHDANQQQIIVRHSVKLTTSMNPSSMARDEFSKLEKNNQR